MLNLLQKKNLKKKEIISRNIPIKKNTYDKCLLSIYKYIKILYNTYNLIKKEYCNIKKII